MANLLYLLGAGASREVLPLARDFAEKLHAFAGELKRVSLWRRITMPEWRDWGDSRNRLIKATEWLAGEASPTRHHSVDAVAKKLFLLGDQENYLKLKAVLVSFLTFEQSRRNVDKRYDSLLKRVLKGRRGVLCLPDNLRILTWNYDTQLERAFYDFCGDHTVVTKAITNSHQVIRMNGCCAIDSFGNIEKPLWTQRSARSNEAALLAAAELYAKNTPTISTPPLNICFAWEDARKVRLAALERIGEVRDMVIIGYSFPDYNQEADRDIFSRFTSLGHIFLQYPSERTYMSVLDRLQGIIPSYCKDKIEYRHIKETDMFYIPDNFFAYG
jgi:hypothetical protein